MKDDEIALVGMGGILIKSLLMTGMIHKNKDTTNAGIKFSADCELDTKH